jgi:hypothetical protein
LCTTTYIQYTRRSISKHFEWFVQYVNHFTCILHGASHTSLYNSVRGRWSPLIYSQFKDIFIHCQSNTYNPHRKKRFTSFPSPAGMSLTKLPLGRNNSVMTSLFPPRESLVVTSRLGTGNSRTFFYGLGSRNNSSSTIFCRSQPPPLLKGPKLEIFVAEFFTQSKPVWVDDLGTRK